jgi:superfamily II DNA or RNA helicase
MNLYNYQEDYLHRLPASCIMAADLGCFAEGTRVLMVDMSYKNIEDIVKGDLVAVADPNWWDLRERKVEFQQKTSNKPKPMIQFTYGKKRTTITATYDHPFWDGERYYPLYEFVWREMAYSQRVQLQLLCEQYGAPFNYAPSRGLSYRDNPTSEGWFRPSTNSAERQNSQSASSGSTNMAAEPEPLTVHQSQRLRHDEQCGKQPRMVYPEAEQPTRLQKRETKQITQGGAISTHEIQQPNDTRNPRLVGSSYRRHAYNRLAYQTKVIHGIKRDLSRDTWFGSKDYSAEKIEIQSISIKKAMPYYSLGIAGKSHTYIVETLPVHNTGKTLMSLAHWERKNTGHKLLVVAPASKIRTEDWQHEALRWFDSSYITGEDGMIQLADDWNQKIQFISYESLRLIDKSTHHPRWWQFCAPRNGGVVYDVIADECHALKNPQAKQSKAIQEIKQSGGLFIGLSGTPMPNGWIDFAGYSKLFGYVKGITEFKQRFCVYQDYKGFPELVKYVNVETMENQLRRVAYKLSRDQAAELPSRRLIGVNIMLSPKANKLYKTLKITRKDPRTDELLDNSSRLLSVLRQSTTESRLDQLLSVVGDSTDNIIVFYNYISERKAILKALAKTDKTILRYDGDQHDTLPKADANISNVVLVAHYKSASTGLNLQWANVTIYFSPTYSYQEFEQSIGRTHRNGQTKKCLYYLFNVKNTVDREIWQCLREKRDFNEKLWRVDDEDI